MDTVKIDLKVFAAGVESGGELELEKLIPVFHRWIQHQSLDELMIDVADYTHVPEGPGVVLVCHDALYAVDQADGELGLLYSRRRETHPSLAGIVSLEDRLASLFRKALQACARLERETEVDGKLRFPANRFLLRVNDRRIGREHADTLRQGVELLAASLFPGEDVRIRVPDAQRRLSLGLETGAAPGVPGLLARLDGSGGRPA